MRSKAAIEALFKRYGVRAFSMPQVDVGRFEVQFEHDGLRVRLPFSAQGLRDAMLEEQPWSSRRQSSRADYECRVGEQAEKAVWRHAAHYLKAVFEAIEYRILTFEQAFLHGFTDADGRTLGQVIIPQLREIHNGLRALPEPDIEAEIIDEEET